jgi:hypothetical protein
VVVNSKIAFSPPAASSSRVNRWPLLCGSQQSFSPAVSWASMSKSCSNSPPETISMRSRVTVKRMSVYSRRLSMLYVVASPITAAVRFFMSLMRYERG